jgi:CHAT domain-containing protein/tetratricopeptide (TPR) repeat protein
VSIAEQTLIPGEEFFSELGQLTNSASRKSFLEQHKTLLRPEVVLRLTEVVVRRIRVDAQESFRLAEVAIEIAQILNSEECLALGLRAKANALYASGDNRAAADHHQRSFDLFEKLELWNEAARTLSASIQPLILLGEYIHAFTSSERAREIFTRLNLPWRLARLEINVGNIFHRQDRFSEAITHYESAYEGLLSHQDAEGMAVVLGNMATCLISLNDFPRALKYHEQARKVSEENSMPLLVAQTDYNIAWLYYLRGEYSRAIEILYATRAACEASGDNYHQALCYMDLSEIYLELNLSDEARETASDGFQRFQKLGMAYESAKSLANEAMALGQQGKTLPALEVFAKAREMFSQEKNLVWPWLLDLYQALLLFQEGRHFEARRLCIAAAEFFDKSVLAGKAVLSHLLLARIAYQMQELDEAQRETDIALAKLEGLQAPVLTHQTYFQLGQIAQARRNSKAAYAAFLKAREALEMLRSRLQGAELKISFVKDRLQVYEALVDLCLRNEVGEDPAREALGYIESAKSRSVIEMIFPSSQTTPAINSAKSGLVRRILDLREELNWYYHRIELEQLRPEERSRERIEHLQKQAQAHEGELLRTLRELPASHQDSEVAQVSAPKSIDEIQSSLAEDVTLVEYYSVGERVVAAVVTRTDIQIVPLTVISRMTGFIELLRFQLAKFRLGGDYPQRFAEPLLRATHGHLESLYAELIAPLRPLLKGRHLIIVPHGQLHFLPFHALRNGEEYLGDAFTISYAPSATVFAICQSKPVSEKKATLILGVPDQRAPQILSEVQSVAGILPSPELFIGDRATGTVLRERGPECGLLHIATHGVYRQDNPVFSGIRLGDGYVNLYDLYQLKLGATLVTLSGCATGMNVVAAGDELIGLQRGLFCAGASSLMLSLWDVHDRSTSELMRLFYTNYIRTGSAASSLQSAMQELRKQYPHPYFWAPFVLIGKLADSKALI